MSHEVETAMFTGKKAWHNVGVVVENAPSTADAIKLAGLDWSVELCPIFAQIEGVPTPCLEHFATVRQSDRRVLGIVGQRYEVLQNSDAFSFFDPMVADGSMQLEAAGSLRKGQRVWILARGSGLTSEVVPGDEVAQYLLLWTSHDGSLATGIQWTPIRVVCANTLRAATDNFRNDASIRIPHTASQIDALAAVRSSLDLARQTFEISIELFRAMQRRGITVEGLEQYVRNIFDRSVGVDEHGSIVTPSMPRAWDSIQAAFESGIGSDIPGVRGTVWGAYNAVTEWLDHSRGRGDADVRLDATWFGGGAQIRQKAFDAAMALV